MVLISVFGATTAHFDVNGPPARITGRARQVLGILALQHDVPIGKEHLAELLWEGHAPDAYAGTLDCYVCLLRRRLDTVKGAPSAVMTTPYGYVIDPHVADVDLWQFQAAAAAGARATGAAAVACAHDALGLVTGELLASEPYAPWAVRARRELASALVASCLRGAQLANGIGDFSSAVDLARSAVAHDRLCEPAWQDLMRAYWFLGLRADALRAWAELREVTMSELAEEPSGDSRALYLAILRDIPAERHFTSADDGGEQSILLDQLRRVLDVALGVDVPAQNSGLVDAARILLAAG